MKKNIWNIIGTIGTIATLFFGIYGLLFVPNYIKEAYNQRQETANNEIITDLKEIIFSDVKCDSLIVSSLKRGKEIKYNISFTKTNIDILLEVQESFMNDKFLSLDQRIILFTRIDLLKSITHSETINFNKAKSETPLLKILTYILSILSLIISGLIMYGLLTKRKQQINDELQKKFEEIEENRPETISRYRNFEKKVGEAIKQLNLDFQDFTDNPRDFSFDYLIKTTDKKIGIEVKTRITPEILALVRKQFNKSGLNALILITERIMNFSTYSMVSDAMQAGLYGKKIYYISSTDIEKIKYEISEILKVENN